MLRIEKWLTLQRFRKQLQTAATLYEQKIMTDDIRKKPYKLNITSELIVMFICFLFIIFISVLTVDFPLRR